MSGLDTSTIELDTCGTKGRAQKQEMECNRQSVSRLDKNLQMLVGLEEQETRNPVMSPVMTWPQVHLWSSVRSEDFSTAFDLGDCVLAQHNRLVHIVSLAAGSCLTTAHMLGTAAPQSSNPKHAVTRAEQF